MKLSQLKNKIEKENVLEGKVRRSTLKDEFKNRKEDINFYKKNESKFLSPLSNFIDDYKENTAYKIDDLIIIGVSGSKGKSTVSKMIHNYLKSIGKKSVLYSSVEIDSFASVKTKNVSCERALFNKDTILDIIEECAAYGSEYLVLEVNDIAINQGLTKDIPFNVRVLTNIHEKNSTEFFSEQEYVEIKKSFIENINEEDNCICVLGMCDQYNLEVYNDLIRSSKAYVVTYGTKYLCEVHNADYRNLDYMLFSGQGSRVNSLKGIKFYVRMKNEIIDIESKSIFSFNTLNILSAISVLDSLGVLEKEAFKKFIYDFNIEGRDEVIKANKRTILISPSLMPHLELLDNMKKIKEFNKLKVLVGAVGDDFITWDKSFSSDRRISKVHAIRKESMEYVDKYSDYILITSNDPGSSNKIELLKEQRSYLKDLNKVKAIVDRREAIKQIIMDSKEDDLIFISGRGNRNVFCESYENMEVYTDKEVIIEVLNELGWYYGGY